MLSIAKSFFALMLIAATSAPSLATGLPPPYTSDGSTGAPELCSLPQYQFSYQCQCPANPFLPSCPYGFGGYPDPRENVIPPDPEISEYQIPKQAGNPFYATCRSSSVDRLNYAQYEILHGIYGGDVYQMMHNQWGNVWFYVVYSDDRFSEGYTQAPYGDATVWQDSYMGRCGWPVPTWMLSP